MPTKAKLLKKSNLKTTLKVLSEYLEGFAKLVMTSSNAQSLGLPPSNGWIVVRSLADLRKAVTQLGWVYEDSSKTLTVSYPNYTEHYHVCEWRLLPRSPLVTSLTDFAVDQGFWIAELKHPSGAFTQKQIAQALDEHFPS